MKLEVIQMGEGAGSEMSGTSLTTIVTFDVCAAQLAPDKSGLNWLDNCN